MWAPGQPAPHALERDAQAAPVHGRRRRSAAALPIAFCKDAILMLLEKHRALVVVGETGSGKSTQLPQYLYRAGWCQGGRCVAITQPRRVAAVTLAERVAGEMGTRVGDGAVGYAVRFDERCGPSVAVKVRWV